MSATSPGRYETAVAIEELGEVGLSYAKLNLWARDEAGNIYLEFRSAGDLVYALCQLSLEDLRLLAALFSKAAEMAEEAI